MKDNIGGYVPHRTTKNEYIILARKRIERSLGRTLLKKGTSRNKV